MDFFFDGIFGFIGDVITTILVLGAAVGLLIALACGIEVLVQKKQQRDERDRDERMFATIQEKYAHMSLDDRQDILIDLEEACNIYEQTEHSWTTMGIDNSPIELTINSVGASITIRNINQRYGWSGDQEIYYEGKASINGIFENRYVLAHLVHGRCKHSFHYNGK